MPRIIRIFVAVSMLLIAVSVNHNGTSATLSIQPALADQNAGQAWNRVCASYGFAAYPQGSGVTFEDAYDWNCQLPYTFEENLQFALAATAELMWTTTPPILGEDELDASIQNWPDD